MADQFFALSAHDQREALLTAASRSGKAAHLLEKDIWVVWLLEALYASPFGHDLVFKGGTSLSKAYDAIGRFSEDVDLTYDIRTIAGDLVSEAHDVIPPTRSQEQRWTKIIRDRLQQWVQDTAEPFLKSRIADDALRAELSVEEHTLFVKYEPHTGGTGYVGATVVLEFGARATGEPSEVRPIKCYAADHVAAVVFPQANTRVMRPERTFWEKATAIHVFCRGGQFRAAERFSRHWYDLVSLDSLGYGENAINDRDLARSVARHKNMFFREKDKNGDFIDYNVAVEGHLQLVPEGAAKEKLAADYRGMSEDGLLFEDPPSFKHLLERAQSIQERANPIEKNASA